jgi:hypothetical protein
MAKQKALLSATIDLGDGDSVVEDAPEDVNDVEPIAKW